MLIKTIHNWELPESEATPEDLFWNRRQVLRGMGLGAATIGASYFGGLSGALAETDPTADLYPAKRNGMYKLDRPITAEKLNLEYNNFYEFGSTKRIAAAAQALPLRPWEIRIDGEVEKEFTIGIDELIRKVGIEERLYRHRCVEAWSMTIPWSGFAMSKLVEVAKPTSAAKFIRMETFQNPEIAPGQKPPLFSWSQSLPWPYIEGVTMEEAANDLSFLVTGAYGKPVAKQMGAPLRLALPWKYGFKSIKSIVRFSFTKERPVSFWEKILPNEYGFWANVNPAVPHPRWSQASERILGTNKRVPTLLYNGYEEQVAGLYKDMNLPDTVLYR